MGKFDIDKIKIFFYDIDGTTFDHSIYGVRESTYKALRELKKKGYKLCICTSRSKAEMVNLDKEFIDLADGVMALAGNYVEIEGKKDIKVFKREEIIDALNYMDENHITYRYATDDGNGYLNRHEKRVEDIFYRLYHMIPPVKDYDNDNIVHINFYPYDEKQVEIIEKMTPNAAHVNLSVTTELSPMGIDKGVAVLNIAEYYGYKKENICCIGDGDNDVSMLKKAAIGIAMGSGTKRCIEAADIVADKTNEDGFYKVLLNLGFIEE